MNIIPRPLGRGALSNPMNAALMNNPIEDLQKVAALRYRAYARHVPEFANQLTIAEAADIDPNTLILLVESKSGATIISLPNSYKYANYR
ncbi:MAG: hypothetical protein AAB293_02375 [Pseudomonadota bacterium]